MLRVYPDEYCHVEEATGMKRDQIIAICVFILGAVYFGLALNLKPPIMRQSVGPEVFPMGIAVAMMLCAVWLFIASMRSKEPDRPPQPQNPDRMSMLTIFLGLLGYGLLLDILGYFVTTVAFLVSTIAVLESVRNHWLRTIVVSLATSFALFWLFDGWLGITLPTGVII